MVLLLLVKPVFDALCMEDVGGVALQLAHLTLISELLHTDCALVCLPCLFIGLVVLVVVKVFHHL